MIATLRETFEQENIPLPDSLSDDLVLLDSGLDSLGFAVLVTNLESKLGFDPFLEDENPFYPVTLGDFVRYYEEKGRNRSS